MQRISFAELLNVILERDAAGARTLTAIAGPPGSGKSTLAVQLAEALNRNAPDSAVVVPMDGYHYDDIVLNARGLRHRKGSPETFDVAGFRHMLCRLQENCEEQIAIPVFDRTLEIARAGAAIIASGARFLIVEGNYLLLNQTPWKGLRATFRTTVMVEAQMETLRERLTRRWVGLGMDDDEARRKVEGNDLPNAESVIRGSASADFVISAE